MPTHGFSVLSRQKLVTCSRASQISSPRHLVSPFRFWSSRDEAWAFPEVRDLFLRLRPVLRGAHPVASDELRGKAIWWLVLWVQGGPFKVCGVVAKGWVTGKSTGNGMRSVGSKRWRPKSRPWMGPKKGCGSNMCPTWGPGKWKHGLKPAVPWLVV